MRLTVRVKVVSERERGLQFVACGLWAKLFRFADVVVGGGDSRWCAVCCVFEWFQRRAARSFRKGKVAGSDGAHGSRRGTAEILRRGCDGVLATANGDSNDEQVVVQCGRELRTRAGTTTTMAQRRDSLFAFMSAKFGPSHGGRQQGFHSRARAKPI